MKYKEICIQADLALQDLNSIRQKHNVVFYVGREEWRELCDHHEVIGNESIKIKDARFFGCPIRILDRDSYFGAGIELKNELNRNEKVETKAAQLKRH